LQRLIVLPDAAKHQRPEDGRGCCTANLEAAIRKVGLAWRRAMTEATFKKCELEDAGRDRVRMTPDDVVAAAELIQQDRALLFLNRFGCLCFRIA